MQTPCISVCTINRASGLCEGCRRTIAEIASWASLTDTERRRIMAELPTRALATAGAAPAPRTTSSRS